MNEFSILHCDFYHLTMAQTLVDGKRYQDIHKTIDTFEMFYRKPPFGGAYAVVAGVSNVVEALKNWKITEEELEILAAEKNAKGKPIFKKNFLDLLKDSKLELTIEAMQDGEIVFPNEPIIKVTGPAWQAFIIETMILNLVNAHSIVATKASRIYSVTKKDGKEHKLLDFSLRRAMSHRGLVETKSAIIGGFDLTSNIYAARKYDLPVSGTHGHSLVMKYGDEYDAFKSYLEAMPENATLLVDTYDTLSGIKNAIDAAKECKIKLKAIRLDSGDLGYLAKKARIMLDNSGFKNAQIIATNDLDEYSINSLLNEQKAPIDIFGVGTKMAIVEKSLGGVYKLKSTDGIDKIKISEQEIKTTIPGGTKSIRIIDEKGFFIGDVIVPEKLKCVSEGKLTMDIVSYNLANSRAHTFEEGHKAKELLTKVFDKGKLVNDLSEIPLMKVRKFKIENFEKFNEEHKRLYNPHLYIAGLEQSLYKKRKKMIEKITDHLR